MGVGGREFPIGPPFSSWLLFVGGFYMYNNTHSVWRGEFGKRVGSGYTHYRLGIGVAKTMAPTR